MGTINHNALIVTVTSDNCIEVFDAWLLEEKLTGFIKSPVVVNGTVTYFFYPDGSKEGWGESDEGDALRQKVVDWMQAQSSWYSDWIEVGYGEYGQKVLRGNNSNCYKDAEYAAS